MSFITQEQAEQILGAEFANASDKARLVLLSNTWMKKAVGFVPDEIADELKIAACEIVKGIQSGDLYSGIERQTKRERVKAEVEVEEEFVEGSVAVSQYEQIARALIDSLDLVNPNAVLGFGFEVFRV